MFPLSLALGGQGGELSLRYTENAPFSAATGQGGGQKMALLDGEVVFVEGVTEEGAYGSRVGVIDFEGRWVREWILRIPGSPYETYPKQLFNDTEGNLYAYVAKPMPTQGFIIYKWNTVYWEEWFNSTLPIYLAGIIDAGGLIHLVGGAATRRDVYSIHKVSRQITKTLTLPEDVVLASVHTDGANIYIFNNNTEQGEPTTAYKVSGVTVTTYPLPKAKGVFSSLFSTSSGLVGVGWVNQQGVTKEIFQKTWNGDWRVVGTWEGELPLAMHSAPGNLAVLQGGVEEGEIGNKIFIVK